MTQSLAEANELGEDPELQGTTQPSQCLDFGLLRSEQTTRLHHAWPSGLHKLSDNKRTSF